MPRAISINSHSHNTSCVPRAFNQAVGSGCSVEFKQWAQLKGNNQYDDTESTALFSVIRAQMSWLILLIIHICFSKID